MERTRQHNIAGTSRLPSLTREGLGVGRLRGYCNWTLTHPQPLPQREGSKNHFTAPDRSSLGTKNTAATSGHLRCQGLIAICVPAWRLIFQAR